MSQSVENVDVFTGSALILPQQEGQLFQLSQSVEIDDFRVLFTTLSPSNPNQINLTSWSINDLTVATSEAVAGTYTCRGTNDEGYSEANVTVNVESK